MTKFKQVKLTREQVYDLLADYALPTGKNKYMVFGRNVKIVKKESESDTDFYNSIIERRNRKYKYTFKEKLYIGLRMSVLPIIGILLAINIIMNLI